MQKYSCSLDFYILSHLQPNFTPNVTVIQVRKCYQMFKVTCESDRDYFMLLVFFFLTLFKEDKHDKTKDGVATGHD